MENCFKSRSSEAEQAADVACRLLGNAKRQKEVLPLAVQLAAAMSVESPFVHLDSIQVKSSISGCIC